MLVPYDPSAEYALRLGCLDVDRETVTEFSLLRSGAIAGARIQKSSGLVFADKLALETLRSMPPLPAPPDGLFKDGEQLVTVPFAFKLLKQPNPSGLPCSKE
jgi:TonB family protein